MKRPDFMALALEEAEAAAGRGEVPVGAVVV
ncbi:MAG: nucleoside deaminase, partial [Mesorhizobium sp.]